jgi:tetratricopeptide (TPR) repeat protein
MRQILIFVLLLLPPSPPASACLNYYGKNIRGEAVETSDDVSSPMKLLRQLTDRTEHIEIRDRDLGIEPAANADFKIRNDYAAKLIHQGKTKRAIEILESIEKSTPGEYRVAANLGTAYELDGDVERALKWISEGIQRYPEVHLGTEWLHVRILEVKRELAKNPDWLQTHTVLDFDFGTDLVPKMPTTWGKMGEYRVLTALRYQLHERLAFVAPPDPIMGELIGILADSAAIKSPVEYAVPLYDLALTFKPASADLLQKRRSRAESMSPSSLSDLPSSVWPLAVAGLAAIILITLVWKRRASRA